MSRLNLSAKSNTVIAGGRAPVKMSVSTDEADIYPGYVVTADTLPNVNNADGNYGDSGFASVATPLGVALCSPSQDLDTAYSANSAFEIVLLGSGTIVWCLVAADMGNIAAGDPIFLSETAGMVCPIAKYITTAATPDVDELAGLIQGQVGRAMEDSANDASDDRWVKVMI